MTRAAAAAAAAAEQRATARAFASGRDVMLGVQSNVDICRWGTSFVLALACVAYSFFALAGAPQARRTVGVIN